MINASLSQLIEIGKVVGINKEEEIVKELGKKLPLKKLKNSHVIMLDAQGNIKVDEGLYDEYEVRWRSIIDKLAKEGLQPTTLKGGRKIFVSKEQRYVCLSLKEWTDKLDKLELKDEIKKKIKELLERGKRVILIVPDRKKQSIRTIENGKEIVCIFCGEKKYQYIPERPIDDLAELLPWLVRKNKNIVFIYSHDSNSYGKNISICKECGEGLKAVREVIDLNETKVKLGNLRMKAFPYYPGNINTLKEDYLQIWIKAHQEPDLEEFVNNIIGQRKREYEKIIFDIVLFTKESNKLNVISEINDIKLKDVIDVIELFNRWKQERKVRDYSLFGKNSIVNVFFEVESTEKKKKNLNSITDFQIKIAEKILKKEALTKNEWNRIYYLFNHMSRKCISASNEADTKAMMRRIEKMVLLTDFLNFYHQYLNTGRL